MWIKYVLGMAAGGLLSAGAFIAGQHWTGVKSPDDYMTAEVFVADADYMTDPMLTADRELVQEFRGRWTAEVSTADGTHVCTGTGQAIYSHGDTLSYTRPLFAWWLNIKDPTEECSPGFWPLPPGDYVVRTIWEVNKTPIVIPAISNVFTVRPAD